MIRDYSALTAYLAERTNMPFVWGASANDCVSFAAGAIRAQTGTDPLSDLAWSNEAEALALIDSLGGLATAISMRFRSIAPAQAMRGDLAGVMHGNDMAIMIVEGMTLVGPGLRRAKRCGRAEMLMAWSAL